MTERSGGDTPEPKKKTPRPPRLDHETALKVRALWTGQVEGGERMRVSKIAVHLGVSMASVQRIVKELRYGHFVPGVSAEDYAVLKADWEAAVLAQKAPE